MSKEKITHKEIRNHFKENFNANDVKYEDIRIITEYITQQEKQDNYTTNLIDIAQHRLEQISLLETKLSKKDELLELYRKLLKLERDDFNVLYKGNSEEYFKEWNKTFKQIKELENENKANVSNWENESS